MHWRWTPQGDLGPGLNCPAQGHHQIVLWLSSALVSRLPSHRNRVAQAEEEEAKEGAAADGA